jgi:hypothetical protein
LVDFFKTKLNDARDETAFFAAWQELQGKYPTPWVIDYLKKEWISCHHRWARPWRQLTVTFAFTGTSMAESINHVLACWLTPSLKLSVR